MQKVKQSPEIESLIREWYRRIAAGEMVAAAEDYLSVEQGFVAIGTDASEWMDDRENLIGAYRETARLGPPEINVQRIETFSEGTIAWAVDVVEFKRPNGIENEMRHTFVLHQENGQWKVVHAHYSFGLPEVSAPKAT
jgi:ketosteroid isomerase-like protein